MLDRYFKIEAGVLPALNWLSRCVSTGIDDPAQASGDELWEAHSKGARLLRGLREEEEAREEGPGGASLLELKVELARRMLARCVCCERRCGADRLAGKTGFCGVGRDSRYSSEFLHMGEEPELVPSHTVFLSGCTFECAYCQNWDIAMDAGSGTRAEPAILADALREGISRGSRNANFVGGNPDPHLWTVLETVRLLGGDARGLPMVWNSNMFTSAESMSLLEGVVDVYLGDFRYGNDLCASELSVVEGYFQVVCGNFARAWESSEVMVRHLVLPDHFECCTRPVMEWTSSHMPGVYFNLMFQYRPEYRAASYPRIDRRLTPGERARALAMAREYGLDVPG